MSTVQYCVHYSVYNSVQYIVQKSVEDMVRQIEQKAGKGVPHGTSRLSQ